MTTQPKVSYNQGTITIRSNGNGILRELKSEITLSNRITGQSLNIIGIWDTGCSKTTFNEEDLKSIDASYTGPAQSQTASELIPVSVYMANLKLSPDLVTSLQVIGNPKFQKGYALIGMDLIAAGDFSITNHGNETVMSFRFPSLHHIDYGKKPDYVSSLHPKPEPSRSEIKVGRNDPCPCGSGKKYKNCHINN